MAQQITNILIVDDHWMSAEGMSSLMTNAFPSLVCHICNSVEDTVGRMADLSAKETLIIADFWLADGTAMALLDAFEERQEKPLMIVLSGDTNPEIERQVRERGAWGFITKTLPAKELVSLIGQALHRDQSQNVLTERRPGVHSRHPFRQDASARLLKMNAADLGLTPRQGDIMQLLLAGRANKVIARELGIGEQTVKEHVKVLLERFSTENRIALIKHFADRRITVAPRCHDQIRP